MKNSYLNIKLDNEQEKMFKYVKETFNVSYSQIGRYLIVNKISIQDLFIVTKEMKEKFKEINFDYLLNKGIQF